MPELLSVFTIPDQWKSKSSVRDDVVFRRIVGVLDSDGRELWAQPNPKKHVYRGSYREGYSQADVSEAELPLGARLGKRFAEFFELAMVRGEGTNMHDAIYSYDCHWLAFWMKNSLDSDYTVDDSLDLAKEAVVKYPTQAEALKLGEIGLLGGVVEPGDPFPVHSFINLEGGLALQAMGRQGAIAIAPLAESLQHYTEIAPRVGYEPCRDHGVRVINSPRELQATA